VISMPGMWKPRRRQRAAPSMNGHKSTASIDNRMPERLERWMLLVSSATMKPTTMYPEGQYQCLRNPHTIHRLSDED